MVCAKKKTIEYCISIWTIHLQTSPYSLTVKQINSVVLNFMFLSVADLNHYSLAIRHSIGFIFIQGKKLILSNCKENKLTSLLRL